MGSITKFNSNLQVTWATGFGSTTLNTNQTTLTGLALGLNNEIYMVGFSENTTNNFPITAVTGPVFTQATANGSSDGIILHFSQNDDLLYSTYMGGAEQDKFNSVAFYTGDNTGNRAYIAGFTKSTDFPTHNTAVGEPNYKNTSYTGSVGSFDGVFVDMINTHEVSYATYYGGLDLDIITSVSVSNNGTAFFTGVTSSTDLPGPIAAPGYYSQTFFLQQDAFICSYVQNYGIQWSTYLGGSAAEASNCNTIDGEDNLYIGGRTQSALTVTTPFPLLDPANGAYFQQILNLSNSPTIIDGFITQFNLPPFITAIQDINRNSELMLFPNPVASSINIPNDWEFESIEILNTLGQIVYKSKGYETSIDVSTYSRGVYIMKVFSKKSYGTVKFVKG